MKSKKEIKLVVGMKYIATSKYRNTNIYTIVLIRHDSIKVTWTNKFTGNKLRTNTSKSKLIRDLHIGLYRILRKPNTNTKLYKKILNI